ncbi:MAG: hypothetical protein RBR05_00190 [Candidatus Methanomethylophilaceae archaeon]|nr:hypothetical protein [Candidatus Methanomethylophilaceae archaeon]MDD3379203.1 hypothetical protein [Candidatus Methanomethylophilaceae archaeon]MDY0223805.1 hypothetical protein [Candidatus Methanomethylophilaceae archaeon]
MISLTVGSCRIDILPIIKGLTSEAEKVRELYGKYEAYAIPLGIEEIQAVCNRKELGDEYEIGELDMVYAYRLSVFGEIETPTPAYCEIVDLCTKDEKRVIPLDMNDDDFTNVYINNIKTIEFTKEHRLAKKGMKRKFDMSSPETFVMDWDKYVNTVKGYAKVSADREKYIAYQLIDIAKYRRSVLAILEYERTDNIVKLVEGYVDEQKLS